MSSRCPVSTARPHRFWSMEYGDRDVTSIGSPLSSANAIAFYLVMPETRTGARTITSASACSAIQPMATEVSRPPEYASTTRCVMVCPLPVSNACVECLCRRPYAWLPVWHDRAAPPGALLTPPFRELQERPRDPRSAGWLPDDHQDGVVACDSAEDRRPGRVIDRRREELCPTRRSAEYHQVGAGLGGEEQFRRDPGQPRGSLPVRPGRRLRARLSLWEAARP